MIPNKFILIVTGAISSTFFCLWLYKYQTMPEQFETYWCLWMGMFNFFLFFAILIDNKHLRQP